MNIVCLKPPHHDFLYSTINDGLKYTENTVLSTSLLNKETEDYCKNAKYVLLFSNTGINERDSFIKEHGFRHKTIYIDGDDREELELPDALGTYPLCFKRELLWYDTNTNLVPLPFAAESWYFQFAGLYNKNIDFSCMMALGTNNYRKDITESLLELNLPNSVVGKIGNANALTPAWCETKKEYFYTLARSKISISYYGSGLDTARFWEILASRALLFSPPIKTQMVYPFIHEVDFVEYECVFDLIQKLKYYLSNIQKAQEIASNGFIKLLTYHTSLARVNYLLKTIEENL